MNSLPPKIIYFNNQVYDPRGIPTSNEKVRQWLEANPERYYECGKELSTPVAGKVSHVYEAWPLVKNDNVFEPLVGLPPMIMKMVRLQPEDYDSRNSSEYAYNQTKAARRELAHISRLLYLCPHANPIFDLALREDRTAEVFTPVTVQLRLNDALQLDEWLYLHRLRSAPRNNSKGTLKDESSWRGIENVAEWARVCLLIGHALDAIHSRRTVHGDVHPGNIFLRGESVNTQAVFIDFAESFLLLDQLEHRKRYNHPYLAPECIASASRRSEKIDIYSFGILMMYLACGKEYTIPPNLVQNERRNEIERLMRDQQPRSLLNTDVRILDMINKCLVRYPGDRPRIGDICVQLDRIYRDHSKQEIEFLCCPHTPYDIPDSPNPERLKAKLTSLHSGSFSPHFLTKPLLSQQIRELEVTIDGLERDIVEVWGTRDRVLNSIIKIVDQLGEGDSWTAATTLDLWQGSGLGLEGSYHTSMFRALKRGAAIRRVFVLTVEDLGSELIDRISRTLAEDEETKKFAGELNSASQAWKSFVGTSGRKTIRRKPEGKTTQGWYEDRFKRLIEFLLDNCRKYEINWSNFNGRASNSERAEWSSNGLTVALKFVSSRAEAEAIKAECPAAIVTLANQPIDLQYLMINVETHLSHDEKKLINRHHLSGARIYRSAKENHYPRDHIIWLRDLFAKSLTLNAHVSNAILSAIDFQEKREFKGNRSRQKRDKR